MLGLIRPFDRQPGCQLFCLDSPTRRNLGGSARCPRVEVARVFGDSKPLGPGYNLDNRSVKVQITDINRSGSFRWNESDSASGQCVLGGRYLDKLYCYFCSQ